MHEYGPSRFLDLSHTAHASLFPEDKPVWTAVGELKHYLSEKLKPCLLGEVMPGAYVGPEVYLGRGSRIAPGAVVMGPAWIGDNCWVAPGCYIRENVIIGDGSIVGNSSEFKNCLLFEGCEVPHFNYVGDSILGYKAHLGAGAVLSNWRLDHQKITIPLADGGKLETGLEKFGSVIGDHVDVGCNSTVSPGSLLGRHSVIYPNTHWRGILGESQIVKLRQQIQIVERRL